MNFYCDASGQRVNLEKSYVFFNKGCSNDLKAEVKQVLEVQSGVLSKKKPRYAYGGRKVEEWGIQVCEGSIVKKNTRVD